MLVDLQTLLTRAPADQLDLRIRQPLRGQPTEHLVAEQLGVDVLLDAEASPYSLTICCTRRVAYFIRCLDSNGYLYSGCAARWVLRIRRNESGNKIYRSLFLRQILSSLNVELEQNGTN
jgi:hypothetical protein